MGSEDYSKSAALCQAITGSGSASEEAMTVPPTTFSQKNLLRAGWLLFMMFAGVGFVALPLDLIRDFIGRPKATITHSEYIKRAKGLGTRAKAVKVDTSYTPSCLD